MKGRHVGWVVERHKAVKVCPSNKPLSIGTAGSITPVDMQTLKVTSIDNGVGNTGRSDACSHVVGGL